MKNKKARSSLIYICETSAIAALYIVITIAIGPLGSAAIQCRIPEAMCVLAIFTPAAVPGLTIGCLISNFATGCLWQDILFGTLATLIGALGTYAFRKIKGKCRFLCILPPIISNTIIIPFVLRYAYGIGDGWFWLAGGVGMGELLSVGVFGTLLFMALEKRRFWEK